MSVDTVRQCANAVLNILKIYGHRDAHAELKSLIDDLDDDDRFEQALREMIAKTDIDAFGALPVAAMSLTEWWAWLRSLRDSCREVLEDRQPEVAHHAVADAAIPAIGCTQQARNPTSDRIGQGYHSRTPALLAAGGALVAAAAAYPATIMAGMPLDRPAELIVSGAVALVALLMGGLALHARRRPARIAPAE